MKYPKIPTVYKRDPDNPKRLLEGEWTTPEIEALSHLDWEFTEKVDGMNIRVLLKGDRVRYAGRSDDTQVSISFLDQLGEILPEEAVLSAFEPNCPAILFGEGFGRKIQKAGALYNPGGVDFVLFDVWVDGIWLRRDDVCDIADKLHVQVVPVIATGPLRHSAGLCKQGFKSVWGDFQAEGLVCRPPLGLLDRRGNRIIAKVKCKDFPDE